MLSVNEYLAADRVAEIMSEYHDGEVFPIENATWVHGRLSVRLGLCIEGRLKGTQCQTAASSVRVRVSPTKYVYPDILVVCGAPAFTDETADTITNPRVVVEILSPTTLDYDYGTKFFLYRDLPSFEEYVLVSQVAYQVEVYRRTPEGSWLLSRYEGPEASFPISALNITLPLAEIYAGVL